MLGKCVRNQFCKGIFGEELNQSIRILTDVRETDGDIVYVECMPLGVCSDFCLVGLYWVSWCLGGLNFFLCGYSVVYSGLMYENRKNWLLLLELFVFML